jgi:hypothetical protein
MVTFQEARQAENISDVIVADEKGDRGRLPREAPLSHRLVCVGYRTAGDRRNTNFSVPRSRVMGISVPGS